LSPPLKKLKTEETWAQPFVKDRLELMCAIPKIILN